MTPSTTEPEVIVRAAFLVLAGTVAIVACSKDSDVTADRDASLALATAASAATPPTVALREEKAGLLARAKVSESQARALALARVPGGRVVDAEIEEEDGRLIYSFDLAVDGREGVTEVEIDATTGDVIGVEHEDEDDPDDDGEDPDDGEDR